MTWPRAIPSWEVDPRGAPIAGASVTVTFTEQIPVKTRIGTDYDFIEKKTVPVYEYTTRQRNAGSVRVRTDARGRFAASVPAGSGHHDYNVTARVADADGLATELGMYATDVTGPAYEGSRDAALVPTGVEPAAGYSVGTPIDLTLRDPAHPGTPASRYLFTLAQLGLRDAVVQDSPRYVGAFQAWEVPNVLVSAVRFTGSAYTSGEYAAWFHVPDRRIDVRLTPDKARYSPRDQATVAVRTTDGAGKPIAASVVLRAIDEKLFVIGGAQLDDPLSDIYTSLGTGILSSYTSHRPPPIGGDGGGDTTGGGGDDFRDEFRDALLFKTVTTGADGRASASFRLSDDLTSWRILGTAFTSDLEAGTGSTEVAVGLPFFVDASIAPEYLVTDRPTIVARAFGTALPPGAKVTISANSPTLGLKSRPIAATAFADVPIRLPALTLGTHSVTITATYGSGSSARTDRLIRTFTVVRSRLATTRTSYLDVTGTVHPDGGAGRTRVVVGDSSAGRYLPLLTELATGESVRLERALAAAAASDLLTGRYGESEAEVPAGDFTGARYQQEDGGISLVPAGSSDLQVSALVALTDPDAFTKGALRQYFAAILADPKATRERHIYALAGLAGLHATVLPQIQAAADDDVTIRERLMLGLGAAALGDATTARSIARALTSGVRRAAGRLGPAPGRHDRGRRRRRDGPDGHPRGRHGRATRPVVLGLRRGEPHARPRGGPPRHRLCRATPRAPAATSTELRLHRGRDAHGRRARAGRDVLDGRHRAAAGLPGHRAPRRIDRRDHRLARAGQGFHHRARSGHHRDPLGAPERRRRRRATSSSSPSGSGSARRPRSAATWSPSWFRQVSSRSASSRASSTATSVRAAGGGHVPVRADRAARCRSAPRTRARTTSPICAMWPGSSPREPIRGSRRSWSRGRARTMPG